MLRTVEQKIALPERPLVWVIGNPEARHFRLLEQVPQPVDFVIKRRPEDFANETREPDILLNGGFPREFVEPLWPRLSKVQWLHSLMAGLESQLFPELVESPVPMTNAAGVFANSLAEFAIAGMLYFAKNLARFEQQRKAARWEQFDVLELRHATLGIFGYGGIGQATAKLAKPFGMRIIAGRRRVTNPGDDCCERIVTIDAFSEVLPELDYLLISSPLTPETKGWFDAKQLTRMKKGSVLINLGRGPIVVEDALIQALREGWIRGAVLDVFDVEPLPSDHVLWTLDNVLLSPHTADHTATWLDEAVLFFVDNYRRVQAGEPLKNVVDKRAGY